MTGAEFDCGFAPDWSMTVDLICPPAWGCEDKTACTPCLPLRSWAICGPKRTSHQLNGSGSSAISFALAVQKKKHNPAKRQDYADKRIFSGCC
jgi:hypothetical protein